VSVPSTSSKQRIYNSIKLITPYVCRLKHGSWHIVSATVKADTIVVPFVRSFTAVATGITTTVTAVDRMKETRLM